VHHSSLLRAIDIAVAVLLIYRSTGDTYAGNPLEQMQSKCRGHRPGDESFEEPTGVRQRAIWR
jgi:hypothetical protein